MHLTSQEIPLRQVLIVHVIDEEAEAQRLGDKLESGWTSWLQTQIDVPYFWLLWQKRKGHNNE